MGDAPIGAVVHREPAPGGAQQFVVESLVKPLRRSDAPRGQGRNRLSRISNPASWRAASGLGYRAVRGRHDDQHVHVPAGQGEIDDLQRQGGTGMARQFKATEAMIHALAPIRTKFDLHSIKRHVDSKNRAVIRRRVERVGGGWNGRRQNGHHHQQRRQDAERIRSIHDHFINLPVEGKSTLLAPDHPSRQCHHRMARPIPHRSGADHLQRPSTRYSPSTIALAISFGADPQAKI